MKKIEKGEYGYIHSQKIRRSLITLVMFLIPLTIFVIGLCVTHKRATMFTFVAIMSCLPGCRMAVSMIMMLLQKSISQETYEKTKAASGKLPQLYEMVFTAYEKNTPVDSIVLGPKSVIGYCSSSKASPEFLEKHLTDILAGNNIKRTVKIYTDFHSFEVRVKEMAALDTAGESAARNEKTRDVLLAIAL